MKALRAVGLGLAAAVVLAAVGCGSSGPLDVYLSLPGVSPFAAGSLQTILIAAFEDEAPVEDFRAGEALEAALEADLLTGPNRGAGRVARARVDAVAGRDGAEVWKAAGAAETPGTVYLAGSVRMSSDIRKAIDRNTIGDGPFDLVARLLAKRRWRLAVDYYVISAATGETLHHTVLSEYQDYNELDKPAEFAFSELSARVLDKLKEVLFASPTNEVRTLLRH
jgi:hypothetical protein